jgi:hypothetical protein
MPSTRPDPVRPPDRALSGLMRAACPDSDVGGVECRTASPVALAATRSLAEPLYPCLQVRPVVLAGEFEANVRQHVHMRR